MELRGALACLYTCTDAEVLVEGRAGAAKTTGILVKNLRLARRFPGSRHLVVRDTRASLTESVLVTLEKLVGEDHPEVLRVKRDQRHSYRLWGSEIVIGGLDRPAALFSTEWDTVYVAEAIEIAEDAWELFGRALRHGKMTDAAGNLFHQRIADCNPGPPGHWLNKRATPCDDHLRVIRTRADYDRLQHFNHHQRVSRMRRLIAVHQDNPSYFDAQAWDWTPAGRAMRAGLESMTGHRRARMLDGRWTAAEGNVFPEFNEARHVIDGLSPSILAKWPHYVFYDPGYDHVTAVLWIAVAPNDSLYIVDEIYEGGRSVEEHAAEIMRRNRSCGYHRTVHEYYGDPQHAFSSTAQSPETIADQFRRATGISMQPWPRSSGKGAKESMVNAARQRLTMDPPGVKVFRRCVNTINEYQSWRFKRTAGGELPPGDDAFEDRMNHCMDCICGAVALNLEHKPQEVQVLYQDYKHRNRSDDDDERVTVLDARRRW